MPLRSFRDLVVWQKSMDLMLEVYRVARRLPDDERFGLTSQVRRAALSVPANIAEGYGRQHRGDYLRFLSISTGSLAELETLLIATVRLEYVERDEMIPIWKQMQEVGKMLRGLSASLKQTHGS